MKVTFEYQAMEIRFGLGLCLFGSLASSFYAFLLVQEQKQSSVKELFYKEEQPQEEVIEAPQEELIEHVTQNVTQELFEKPSTPQATHPAAADTQSTAPSNPESHTLHI